MEIAHFGLIESNSNFAPKTAACNSFDDHKNLCMLQHIAHSCSPSSSICIIEVLFCYVKHCFHSINADGPRVQVLLKIYRIRGGTTKLGGRISKQPEWENQRHWKRRQGQWVGAMVAHARVFAIAVQLRWSALQLLRTELVKRCASVAFDNLLACSKVALVDD